MKYTCSYCHQEHSPMFCGQRDADNYIKSSRQESRSQSESRNTYQAEPIPQKIYTKTNPPPPPKTPEQIAKEKEDWEAFEKEVREFLLFLLKMGALTLIGIAYASYKGVQFSTNYFLKKHGHGEAEPVVIAAITAGIYGALGLGYYVTPEREFVKTYNTSKPVANETHGDTKVIPSKLETKLRALIGRSKNPYFYTVKADYLSIIDRTTTGAKSYGTFKKGSCLIYPKKIGFSYSSEPENSLVEVTAILNENEFLSGYIRGSHLVWEENQTYRIDNCKAELNKVVQTTDILPKATTATPDKKNVTVQKLLDNIAPPLHREFFRVNATKVNLRSYASFEAEILQTLSSGSCVTLESTASAKFLKVSAVSAQNNHITGFVSKDYLSPLPKNAVTPETCRASFN